MPAVKVAGVVLAAGLSTRFGGNKQLAELNGETLAGRAVRIAKQAGLDPVIAVVGDAVLVESLQKLGAVVLLNSRPFEGLSSSIAVGVGVARSVDVDGVLLMTCDQPTLTVEHLYKLVAEPGLSAGSAYAGKIGIPAYFPKDLFDSLLSLKGDTGARDLLRGAHTVQDESLALDIDTPADLERAREDCN